MWLSHAQPRFYKTGSVSAKGEGKALSVVLFESDGLEQRHRKQIFEWASALAIEHGASGWHFVDCDRYTRMVLIVSKSCLRNGAGLGNAPSKFVS